MFGSRNGGRVDNLTDKMTFVQYVIVAFGFVTTVNMYPDCYLHDGVYIPASREEKLYYSDIMAYGTVKAMYPRHSTLYDIKFEVFCSFKGDPLPQFINITRAGYESDICSSKDFTEGESYFAYLNEDFTPSYSPDVVTNEYEVHDIPLYCEAEIINYPKGIDENTGTFMCPEPYPDYEGCIKHTPTSPVPTDHISTSITTDMNDINEGAWVHASLGMTALLLSVYQSLSVS